MARVASAPPVETDAEGLEDLEEHTSFWKDGLERFLRNRLSLVALFLVLLVLLGFGPSFYLRGIVPAYPRPNPSLPSAVIV